MDKKAKNQRLKGWLMVPPRGAVELQAHPGLLARALFPCDTFLLMLQAQKMETMEGARGHSRESSGMTKKTTGTRRIARGVRCLGNRPYSRALVEPK